MDKIDTHESRRLALDAIPVGITLADASREDEPLIYANPAFERLTGYSSADIIGRNCRFLQGPDTDGQSKIEMSNSISERRPFHGTVLNYRKDGTSFWNELTITPIQDGGDEVRYFVGVQVDVTPRLELEGSLREAQKMEAVGKLAGGIAHDFNNLLAVILGSAESVREIEKLNAESLHCVSDIISAVDTGATLVKRMLEFSRSSSADLVEVNINELIKDTVRLLERTIREPTRFECELSTTVGCAHVNRASLETALINLCVNAADAMPEGGIIRIKTKRRRSILPGSRDAVEITVYDTGVGMDLETRTRAFEPFYTTKPSGVGSGLGLSMVYNFTKQSGGQVRIESEVEKGTSVSLLLPSLEAESVGEPNEAVDRFIVVEDDDTLRNTLVRLLRAEGFRLEEARTAEEALELLRSNNFPLVLSDVRLAGQMSGIDLMRLAGEEGLDARFLLMTGFTSGLGDARREGLEPVVLRKPFRKQELLAAIKKVQKRD